MLRSGDMEYVMLHLIFSLPHMPGEGQPAACAASALWFQRILLVAHYSALGLSVLGRPTCDRGALLCDMLMLCLVFATAGPVMPGAGDVSTMDPTMAHGAAPNMLPFAPDGRRRRGL